MKSPRAPYFYCITSLIALADMICFFWFEQHIVAMLTCWYIICMIHDTSWPQRIFILMLLSLESFYFYGSCGLTLIYLIPAGILALQAKHKLYAPELQKYSLLVLCLIIHGLFIDHYVLGMADWGSYTMPKILVNLLLMVMVSLK